MELLETVLGPLRDGLYAVMMPISNFIWSYILVYLLLGAGLLFTIMTETHNAARRRRLPVDRCGATGKASVARPAYGSAWRERRSLSRPRRR